MRILTILSIGVSCLPLVGNGQEPASPVSVSAPQLYGVQGNVATNRQLHQSEMDRAVAAARARKDLMSQAASQGIPRPVYTSASQYLSANRPPAPPPSETPPSAPIQRETFVPQFQTPSNPSPAPASTPAPVSTPPVSGNPQQERNFFKWMAGRNQGDVSSTPAGASTYTSSSEPQRPGTLQESSAVNLPSQDKPNLFGKLFNRDQADPGPTSLPPAPAPQSAPEPAPASPAPTSIPEAPGFSDPAPAPAPAPSSPTGSIFVKRDPGASSGNSASVKSQTQAEVSGVLVTLYEGDNVTVLSTSGGTATVRLADGRTGTVDSSALSR